jgi:hypothetical protein
MTGSADSSNSGEIKVIVRTLAALAFTCVIVECVLSYFQLKIPPELNTLTGGLVGSMTAMLVKTAPTSNTTPEPTPTPSTETPTPVKVVNPKTDPVPTVTT